VAMGSAVKEEEKVMEGMNRTNGMNGKNRFNMHDLLDRIGASLGGLVYRNDRIFGKSLDSVSLSEAAGSTVAEAGLLTPGIWQKVTADGPAGHFQGGCFAYRWSGSETPTLLYIHGSGEQPYNFGPFKDNSFRKIFADHFKPDVNLVLLAAPFHDRSQGEYIKALGYLNNYVGMLAAMAAIVDTLAEKLKSEGCPSVFVAGFSLGGWVANLHRAFYGKNVDCYVPICAGTRPSDVFVSSEYRKLTSEKARSNPDLLREKLDFDEAFMANKTVDCYPLMFRYDRLTELRAQMPAYRDLQVEILEKGHFTGQQATGEFRKHIQHVISR